MGWLEHDESLRVGREILQRHGIAHRMLRRSPYGENAIVEAGDELIVKIFAPQREQHARELAALTLAAELRSIQTPRIVDHGNHDGLNYIVMTRIEGTRLTEVWPKLNREQREPMVRELSRAMQELAALSAGGTAAASLKRDWRQFVEKQASESIERQRSCGVPPQWLDELRAYLEQRELVMGAPSVFLHGDIHAGNMIVREAGGQWTLAGIVDFGDSFFGPAEYEFVAPGVLLVQGDADLQIAMFEEYGYARNDIDDELRRRLMLLTIFYECSDLRKYALRLRPDAINLSLAELERAIYPFAHTPRTRPTSSPR